MASMKPPNEEMTGSGIQPIQEPRVWRKPPALATAAALAMAAALAPPPLPPPVSPARRVMVPLPAASVAGDGCEVDDSDAAAAEDGVGPTSLPGLVLRATSPVDESVLR